MHIPFTCKHDWKVLSETVTKSRFEVLTQIGDFEGLKTRGGSMFKRKHIQIITCDKCGKLKRFVDEI